MVGLAALETGVGLLDLPGTSGAGEDGRIGRRQGRVGECEREKGEREKGPSGHRGISPSEEGEVRYVILASLDALGGEEATAWIREKGTEDDLEAARNLARRLGR